MIKEEEEWHRRYGPPGLFPTKLSYSAIFKKCFPEFLNVFLVFFVTGFIFLVVLLGKK